MTERHLDDRDGPRDECGVFGVYAPGHDVARLTYFGLYALQHRGQESAGIATCEGGMLMTLRDLGLVSQVFDEEKLQGLAGDMAIGHVRYSTAGASNLRDAQPFLATTGPSQIAVAHNGNLTNATAIRAELEGHGSIFQSTMDSEVFVHLFARARGTLEERLGDMCSRVRGAWSAMFLIDDVLVAARDPYGFRPLSLGRLGQA